METLSPSILQIRDSILEQLQNEKLETISKRLDELFDVERDPVRRIVFLASRVETIRNRIKQIYQDKNITKKIEKNLDDKEEVTIKVDNQENEDNKSETWVRVIMKESTEVNGVRFPEGIQIDVTEDDSKKLIETGKAAIIS